MTNLTERILNFKFVRGARGALRLYWEGLSAETGQNYVEVKADVKPQGILSVNSHSAFCVSWNSRKNTQGSQAVSIPSTDPTQD